MHRVDAHMPEELQNVGVFEAEINCVLSYELVVCRLDVEEDEVAGFLILFCLRQKTLRSVTLE